jgi:cytochrome c-type biogenesis protein CcmE
MNIIHKRRLYYISLLIIGLALAVGLILYALRQNINVFLTPSQIITAQLAPEHHFRLGGMVKKGSVQRDAQGLGVQFIVTDLQKEIHVHYSGILPDLFREGKGVVADGRVNAQGVFIATQILAKHDENYMPKGVPAAKVSTPTHLSTVSLASTTEFSKHAKNVF